MDASLKEVINSDSGSIKSVVVVVCQARHRGINGKESLVVIEGSVKSGNDASGWTLGVLDRKQSSIVIQGSIKIVGGDYVPGWTFRSQRTVPKW